MFVFQVQKSEEDGAEERRHGTRVRRGGDFLAAAMAMPDDQFAGALESLDREFKKQGVSKFMSTLTPGAQNAINAGSFVWGYENAAKYVQNAMKLGEVKNAANEAERSKAVIESVQQQAGGETKVKAATTFAWGYYNEDMKQSQAQAGVSETLSEKEKTKEEERQQSGILMPLSAAEAVSMGIAHGATTPQMLYCSAAGEAVKSAHEQQEEGRKRAKLEALESGSGGPRIIALTPEASRMIAEKEVQREAEKRVQQLIREHAEAERALQAAIAKLGSVAKYDEKAAMRVAALLPPDLGRVFLAGSRKSGKKAARKKLASWLAFSKSSKKALGSLHLGKLLKLASLSSLFR